MELQRLIRTGITASALGHLLAVTMVLISAEVHPFVPVPSEPITVDIVTPDEVPAPKPPELPPEPKAEPSDSFDLSSKAAAAAAASPAASEAAAAQPQKQAAPATKRPISQQAAAQAPSPAPAFTPPAPDLTIKYNVLLGLPPDMAAGGFDSPATPKANDASSLIVAFRRHLRTCSKLPKSVASSEPIRIMLRVFMTLDGKLASDPVLIEASASAKGPALMQSAIGALQACQPYTMLPADRYGEWKVLDLSFTPQDFAGG